MQWKFFEKWIILLLCLIMIFVPYTWRVVFVLTKHVWRGTGDTEEKKVTGKIHRSKVSVNDVCVKCQHQYQSMSSCGRSIWFFIPAIYFYHPVITIFYHQVLDAGEVFVFRFIILCYHQNHHSHSASSQDPEIARLHSSNIGIGSLLKLYVLIKWTTKTKTDSTT